MKSYYVEYEMENMTCLIDGGLAWELNAWCDIWILFVKEFQGKLLVMVVSVYLDIGDV